MTSNAEQSWRDLLKETLALAIIVPLLAASMVLNRQFGDVWSARVWQALGGPGLTEEQLRILLFDGTAFVLWMAGLAIYFRVIKPKRKPA